MNAESAEADGASLVACRGGGGYETSSDFLVLVYMVAIHVVLLLFPVWLLCVFLVGSMVTLMIWLRH